MSQVGSSSTCLINQSLVSHGDETIQSANYEVNISKDSGLWLDFYADGVAYWNARQHHNEPFNKSYRHFSSDQPVRYCSQKHFVDTKVNGEKYESVRISLLFCL